MALKEDEMKHWSKWNDQDCKAVFDALHLNKAVLTESQIAQLDPGKTVASIMLPQQLFELGWITGLRWIRENII